MRCGGQQPNSAFAELAASAACAAALAGRRRCGSNVRLQRAPDGIGVPFCVRISWPEVRSPCHTAQHTAWRRSGRAQQGVDATRSPCHRAAASLRLARRDAEQQRTLRYSWSLWPGGAFGAPIMLAVATCSAIAKVCSAKGSRNVPLDIAASHESVANSQQSRRNCVAASQVHRCCSTTPHSPIGRQWAFHRLPDETPALASSPPRSDRLPVGLSVVFEVT
jgi:hypothetical protein